MADDTRTSLVVISSALGRDDVLTIANNLLPVAPRWELLANCLKLSTSDIANIGTKHGGEVNQALFQVISRWIATNVRVTWSDLVEALRQPILDETWCATQIEEKFCIHKPTPCEKKAFNNPNPIKGPTMSIDDYKELHTVIKKWINEKRAAAQNREFPHSVEELKSLMAAMEKVKSKEMPSKKREMKSLVQLSEQLKALKAKISTSPIPTDMEYSKLEQDWTDLEKETNECQKAMQDELDRLQGLQTLAEKILSKCDGHDAILAQIEKRVQQFEESSTKMDPQEAVKMASELQHIDALEKLIGDLQPGVQELKDGKYHDVEKVEERVESLASNLHLLGPRMKEMSLVVDEAQAVVAMETSHKELEEFQLNRLSAVEQQMSRITNTPPPPSLEDMRWEQVVKQTKDRVSGLEPILDVDVELDGVKNPLGECCVQQREYFENPSPLEVTPEQLLQQQKTFKAVVADTQAHSEQMERTEQEALKFVKEAETQLKNQAIAPAELITELCDKRHQLDEKYSALRKFVQESTELLVTEKPVGQSAARIEEQMKTCQESRSKVSEKQPTVDAMLALGRSIRAVPSTTSQNDTLMQKLTGFIKDWSELQMAWQNWYNKLHANLEQSKSLSDRLQNFEHNMRKLKPACAGLFPATVAMETLDSELKEIQVKFDSEVIQIYEEQKSMYETLKANVSLLPETSTAQETFKMFETAAEVVESYQQDLSDVVNNVCGWWGGCEAMKVWMDEAEKMLSAHTPLASSVDIVQEQKRSIEKLSSEVDEHRSEVEKALRSLEELAKYKFLNPAPIEGYMNKLKRRWEAVCQQSKLVEFNQRVGEDEGATLPEHFIDPSVEDSSSAVPLKPPTFDGQEYQNGIRSKVVADSTIGIGSARLGGPVQIAQEWKLGPLHNIGVNGGAPGIIIIILDSAVDDTYGPIANKGQELQSHDFVTVTKDMTFNNSHGTHCATIAAGVSCDAVEFLGGVAPAASLVCCHVSPDGKNYQASAVTAALKYLLEQDAGKGCIVSMSFGFEKVNKEITEYINELTKRKVVCVAAAGNDGPPNLVMFPASLGNVISVGSCKSTGQPSDFNHIGSIDVCAPGENLVPDALVGTSFAAPAIAGIIALLIQQVSKLGKPEMIERICDVNILRKILSYDLKAHCVDVLAPHELLEEGPQKLEQVIMKYCD